MTHEELIALRAGLQPKQPGLTKAECLRMLRLLSSLETLLLFSGRQNQHAQQHIPDHLLDELTAMSELLEREILQ